MDDQDSFPGLPHYIQESANARDVQVDAGQAGAQFYLRRIGNGLGQLDRMTLEDRKTVIAEARADLERYAAAGEGTEAAIDHAEDMFINKPQGTQRGQKSERVPKSRGIPGDQEAGGDVLSEGTGANPGENQGIGGPKPDHPEIPNSGINPEAGGRWPSGPGTAGAVGYGEATPADTANPAAIDVVRPGEGNIPFTFGGPRGAVPSVAIGTVEPGSPAHEKPDQLPKRDRDELEKLGGIQPEDVGADDIHGSQGPGIKPAEQPEPGHPEVSDVSGGRKPGEAGKAPSTGPAVGPVPGGAKPPEQPKQGIVPTNPVVPHGGSVVPPGPAVPNAPAHKGEVRAIPGKGDHGKPDKPHKGR